MSRPTQNPAVATPAPARNPAWLPRTLWAALLALFACLCLAPARAHAGTITIVDGPASTQPVNGVYTDGYIRDYLAITGSLTISTASVLGGVDDIRVLDDTVIAWSTGNTLSLDAESNIVISGTIQHDGPATGAGGIRLRASASPDGTVTVGTGAQNLPVAVGSRFGLTRVDAGYLSLNAGDSGNTPFAHLGFRAVNKGTAYTVTGVISLTVAQDLVVTGGAGLFAYAQIGHGGSDFNAVPGDSGSFSGPIAAVVGGDVTFEGGDGNAAYAQFGNGGYFAAGNHSGSHRLLTGGSLSFVGGSEANAFAHFGNGGYQADGNHAGSHTLAAGDQVVFVGGALRGYVQLGNGGYSAAGNQTGSHRLLADTSVSFLSGSADFAYAHFGNGGYEAAGNHSGSHTLEVDGSVFFQADGDDAYAQFGNGGTLASGNHTGNHTLTAGGGAAFQGGAGGDAYAHFGNGGNEANGNHGGNHTLTAEEEVTFQAGVGSRAYAHFGNGGNQAEGNHTGNHRLDGGQNVAFQASVSSFQSYVQAGNGGALATGVHSGNHTLVAAGDVAFQASGALAFAQMGNGGRAAGGGHSGSHSLSAGGDATFAGGSVNAAYAHFGNGGPQTEGTQTGNLTLTTTGDLNVLAGSGSDAYAMLGHGSDNRADLPGQSEGDRAGNIALRIGATAVISAAQVGHATGDGATAITAGNTFLGVSQNDPAFATGAGQLLVNGVSRFNSAPPDNGGELRVYLPRPTSQQTPTTATFNGNSFAVANTIPPDRIQGFFLFGSGPYFSPYSFYLGGRPALAIVKSATPAGPLLPGQPLTYTLRFTNTGNITATNVVITDTLPAALTFTAATLAPDAGVIILPTAGAPNLAWSITTLGLAKGGRIHIAAALKSTPALLGTTFTNTAVISATGDITPVDNIAALARSVIAGATLHITKTVVGPPPADPWQFSVSGGAPPGPGGFPLPATGGSHTLTGLSAAAYTLTETTIPGYLTAVTCTNGASGANSVQLTLSLGSTTGCTFTNTEQTVAPGAVSGLIYEDANGNQQPDPGEGIAGITVTLQSDAGVVAALTLTDVTDADGLYSFAAVPPDDYTLSFAMPPGYRDLENLAITVAPGQAVEAPDLAAVKEGAPGIHLPVIQR